jgi:HEPN domain-containing protein
MKEARKWFEKAEYDMNSARINLREVYSKSPRFSPTKRVRKPSTF